jgi:uncharacterized protein
MTRVRLEGARVLLTGATGGIGGAIARRLAGGGAQLVLSGRRRDVLTALAREVGGQPIVADLARREDVAALVAEAGEIDVLIANAGLPGTGRLCGVDPVRVDHAIEVNLRAPIALARALAPSMVARGHGHLVFIGSLSGKAASGGSSLYSATKFGLRGFALALREELEASGVGVSLIAPGFVSEAGMFSDTGIVLPVGFSTRTPAQVADAVAEAIVKNRGEVSVASLLMRVGADIANLAPGVAMRVGRLIRADRLARQFEDRQADRR